MHKCLFSFILGLIILFYPIIGVSNDKQLIMIIDTSGSMATNDPAAYAIQTAKIINDLLQVNDKFSAIRFPSSGNCSDTAKSGLVVSKNIKTTINPFINRSDDTDFTAPIMTALKKIDHQNSQKILIIISDVGGKKLLSCAKNKKMLDQLKKSGVTMAAINIGAGDLTNNNNLFAYSKSVNNSPDLIEAVANIYQRFIGGKNTQTGKVSGKTVTISINTFVKEAFLVIASEGKVGDAIIIKPHPELINININHKGGGTTKGHDGRQRSYRIIRLENPGEGEWSFLFTDMNSKAGWMLIQDYSVGLRLVTDNIVTSGVATTMVVELYNESTGKSIGTEQETLLTVEIDGIQSELTKTTDGKFQFQFTPSKIGDQEHIVHINTENLDKNIPIKLKVIEETWVMDVHMPEKIELDTEITLQVTFTSKKGLVLPNNKKLVAKLSTGEELILKRTSENSSKYLVNWKSKRIGITDFLFEVVNNPDIIPVKKQLSVVSSLEFGIAVDIGFGHLTSETSSEKLLDFNAVKVKGSVDIQLLTDFNNNNTQLQIYNKGQWQKLNGSTITLSQGGKNQWKVKIITQKCPDGVVPSEIFHIRSTYNNLSGAVTETDIEISVEIIDDIWYECWWPLLLAIFILLVAWRIFYCMTTTAKFPAEFGLLLSSEPEISEEGIFHRIRSYEGAKRRFCHDAKIYLHEDFRFTSSENGAFVKLKAGHNGVYLLAMGNGILFQKRLGEDWDEVKAHEEILLRSGVIYKNDLGTLFFEAR